MQHMLDSNLEKHLVRAQSLQEVLASEEVEKGMARARGERAGTQQRMRRGDGASTPRFRGGSSDEHQPTAGDEHAGNLDEEATPAGNGANGSGNGSLMSGFDEVDQGIAVGGQGGSVKATTSVRNDGGGVVDLNTGLDSGTRALNHRGSNEDEDEDEEEDEDEDDGDDDDDFEALPVAVPLGGL